MNDNEHPVILNSGASRNLFPDNSAASFRTKLCEPLILKPVPTHWECGAELVHIPANYYNINDYCQTIVIKKSKRSKAEVTSQYTVPRYVFFDYVVTHTLDNLSATDFVKYVNSAVNVSAYKHFKLELSTLGAERKNYSSSSAGAKDDGNDAETPVFVFKLGKGAKVTLNVDGMGFWTHYLNIDPSLIGHELVSSFTVKVREQDVHSPFIRILYPFTIRVSYAEGEDVLTSIIPKIFPDDEITSISIPIGNYKNEKSLIQQIKTSIDEKVIEKNQNDNSRREVFRLNVNNDNTVSIEILHSRYAFQFTDDLAYALGFKKHSWYDNSVNKGLLPIDLHYNLNTIYVYSDVVSNSIVSNVKAPLLTMLPVKQKPQDRIIPHYPPRVIYYPVSKTVINEITISMAGDFGKVIPFVPGIETTIKLHFRIYKP